MRKFSFLLLATLALLSCGEAEPLCKLPPDPLGFFPINQNNTPTANVKVDLKVSEFFSLDDDRTFVIYSVPDIFIYRGIDTTNTLYVSKSTEYYFKLKDPANAPDSVIVSAYLYNDCGETEKVYGLITYNTTP